MVRLTSLLSALEELTGASENCFDLGDLKVHFKKFNFYKLKKKNLVYSPSWIILQFHSNTEKDPNNPLIYMSCKDRRENPLAMTDPN